MAQIKAHFSTTKISPQLVEYIINILKDKAYGSIEIYIENYHITQVTERTITKVINPLPKNSYQVPKAQNKISS